MLTDEMRADGWIEHDGGECPVPLDSAPDVLLRGWRRDVIFMLGGEDRRAKFLRWSFNPLMPYSDNIAYRPEPPHDPR